MATQPAPPLTPVPAKRRRRWWRVVLLLLALAILVPLVIFAYITYTTRQEWAEAEAEADRSDPHWRLAQLIEEQEAIPDKENSALFIKAVAVKAKNFSVAAAADYDLIFEKLPPNSHLNAQQLELIRGKLAMIAKPLAEARQLKDMPRGRFPVRYSNDYIATPIPDHHGARDLADWLSHDAYLLAHEGKYDDAIESCRASLNTGRAMLDDLFLIAHLIRANNQTMTLAALERVLAQGEASDQALQAMQAAIEREMKDSGWLRAIRGERAGGQLLFDNIRTGKVEVTYLRAMCTGKKASTFLEWISDTFPTTMLKYYPEHLRHMTECVEIAKLPIHEQRPRIDAWAKKSKESRNPVIELLTPALAKVHQAECRSQANLRTALVALACERYRLKHKDNAWPASLDELVKDKLLDTLPVDPMDGQPLRYRRKKDHIVIYSIGLDGIDNDGHIDRDQTGNLAGIDLGFRLWNKEHRAGPPRPPVVPPAGPRLTP